jgi:hypothetical protein
MPQALEAAAALIPLADRVPSGIDVTEAIERVRRYAGAMLADSGLPELGTLVGYEPSAPTAPAEEAVVPGGPVRRRRAAGRVSRTGAPSETAPSPSNGEGTYDFVGIVMAKSAEGDAVAEILGRRDDIEVMEQPAFWDIRARDRLVIPYDDVSQQLGYEIDAYSIQHEMSTHYGRMVAGDDALMLFSDPTEAMQYLMA